VGFPAGLSLFLLLGLKSALQSAPPTRSLLSEVLGLHSDGFGLIPAAVVQHWAASDPTKLLSLAQGIEVSAGPTSARRTASSLSGVDKGEGIEGEGVVGGGWDGGREERESIVCTVCVDPKVAAVPLGEPESLLVGSRDGAQEGCAPKSGCYLRRALGTPSLNTTLHDTMHAILLVTVHGSLVM